MITLVWVRSWTGRWSPCLRHGAFEDARENREVTVPIPLTGEWLTLAQSQDPQRLARLARAFPAPLDRETA